MKGRTVIQQLVLKFESIKTLYEGPSEVRRYRNDITGVEEVGKRFDIFGLEQSVAVLEAKLLQTIRHPNIVPVNDVAHVPNEDKSLAGLTNVIELIMPYYPRGSLCDAMLRGERFSVGEACLLAQAALRGLGELHDKYGILHRDIKSGNVLLPDDGTRIKVGDLGIAVQMDGDGTAEPYAASQLYTPPETYTQKRVDCRYDLYGVGLLLLEMLNGPFPYSEHTTEDAFKRLQKGQPALRREHLVPDPQVPRRLRTIIHKLTSRDPAERYSTASDVSQALSRVQMIDWQPVQEVDVALLWEGAAVQRPDRRFQVEAQPRRNGQWIMSARQRVNRWQKFVPDQIVAAPKGSQATDFFDQVLKAALSA